MRNASERKSERLWVFKSWFSLLEVGFDYNATCHGDTLLLCLMQSDAFIFTAGVLENRGWHPQLPLDRV